MGLEVLIAVIIGAVVWVVEHVVDLMENRSLFPAGPIPMVTNPELMDDTDRKMIKQSREILETWLGEEPAASLNSLIAEDRKKAIEGILNDLVKLYGLEIKGLQYDDLGRALAGFYDDSKRIICINYRFLLCDDEEALNNLLLTLFHELSHAVQYNVVRHPGGLWDKTNETARRYATSIKNYIRPEVNFEAYANQLIEVDADTFAALVLERKSESGVSA